MAAQVQVVADHLLEKLPPTQRPIEQLRPTDLELENRHLVVTAPYGDEDRFVVLQAVRVYVAHLRLSLDETGNGVSARAAGNAQSPSVRAVRSGRPAA